MALQEKIESKRRSEARWGQLVISQGFVIIPTSLFIGQKRLSLSANEFNIVLQIISFWWDEKKHPFPSRQKLADRMSVSVKTIQRGLASLEKKGLLKRIGRFDPKRGRVANSYDLSGLVAALRPIANDQAMVRNRRLILDESSAKY